MATQKVTVNLPETTIEKLRELATARDITMTEALRQSIETESFFWDQQAQGNKIVVEEPTTQKKSRVVLR